MTASFPLQLPSSSRLHQFPQWTEDVITLAVQRKKYITFAYSLHALAQQYRVRQGYEHYARQVVHEAEHQFQLTPFKTPPPPQHYALFSPKPAGLVQVKDQKHIRYSPTRSETALYLLADSYGLQVNYHYHQERHRWNCLDHSTYGPDAALALHDLLLTVLPASPAHFPFVRQRYAPQHPQTEATLLILARQFPDLVRYHETPGHYQLGFLHDTSFEPLALWKQDQTGSWHLTKVGTVAAEVLFRELLIDARYTTDQCGNFWTFKQRGRPRINLKAATPFQAYAQLICHLAS